MNSPRGWPRSPTGQPMSPIAILDTERTVVTLRGRDGAGGRRGRRRRGDRAAAARARASRCGGGRSRWRCRPPIPPLQRAAADPLLAAGARPGRATGPSSPGCSTAELRGVASLT